MQFTSTPLVACLQLLIHCKEAGGLQVNRVGHGTQNRQPKSSSNVNSLGAAVRQTMDGGGPPGDKKMPHSEMHSTEAEMGGKGSGVEKTAEPFAGELWEVNVSQCKTEKPASLVSFMIEVPLKSTLPERDIHIY